MHSIEIRDFAELQERFGQDWRRIAAASEKASVFQTSEWTNACWRHFAGRNRLCAVAFVEEGVVNGLAVCYLPSPLAPLRALRFVGEGVSDYLDLLAAPGREDSITGAFGNYLRGGNRWDAADFAQARPESIARRIPGIAALPGETCPYLPLPADWDTFRRGLGKKLRQNIGYYERSLGKLGALIFRTATEETLSAELAAFFALHQQRWRQRGMPGAFASEKMQAFHRDAAAALLRGGMLRLHTLSLDGEIRAALYCFQKGGTCYYYLGGFAQELTRYSIGTVLTAYAIRYAIEKDSATEFDFLRGNEGYKYRWGAQDRFNARLILPRPGIRSAIITASAAATLVAELRLKDWMHRRHGGAGASDETTETKNG